MSRLLVLILFVLLLLGGLYFLSIAAREGPTRTIEVEVGPQGGNAA